MLKQLFIIILSFTAIFFMATDASGQKKKTAAKKTGIESVTAEKKKAEREIKNTAARIEAKKAEISRQLNKLNTINADIESNSRSISQLNARCDSISGQISATEDSILILEQRVSDLRRMYITAMRKLQPYHESTSMLAFVFSSKNFETANQRIRYLRQFSQWRNDKAAELTAASDELLARKKSLTELEVMSSSLLQQSSAVQNRLTKNKAEADKLVKTLRSDEASLRAVLEKQKKQAKSLNDRLERLIAEQQAIAAREEAEAKKNKASEKSSEKKAKTEDKKSSVNTPTMSESPGIASHLSGTFADNKGKLSFPVTGKYRIISKFGRQPHPSLPKVEIENSGIDILASPGSQARAVFDGKISAIFKEDGYNSIVMVRHGKYISIYAGLSNLSVKTGDSVKTGQNLGKISGNSTHEGSVLHFEIRNERTKLDPSAWLGK